MPPEKEKKTKNPWSFQNGVPETKEKRKKYMVWPDQIEQKTH